MKTIETRRFILRTFSAGDWPELQALARDWKDAPGPESDKFPTDEEGCRAFAGYLAGRDDFLAMTEKSTARLVGLIALNGLDGEGRFDLGHVILSEYKDGDRDREALAAAVDHIFASSSAVEIVAKNADDPAQLAALEGLGFKQLGATRGILYLKRGGRA
jgi:hypothetical protein